MIKDDIEKIFLTEEDLKKTVQRLGKKITADYNGREVVLVCILKGSFVFTADLVRAVDLPLTVDFMVVSSYGSGTESSGDVKILKDLAQSIEGKDVIVVEDIIDSGITLNCLLKKLKARNPNSLRLCTLLSKPDRRKVEVAVDYLGCEVPDYFLVGYGLDYAEKYRNLPYIGVLKPSVYE
jgi:hypoxanthine phosphoribosyltransferase